MSMSMYRWELLDWATIERRVFKLQKRIYQASQRGDVKAVHSLQKLLMKSWSAKCLAVRRVTQDNRGKKTAGVDGVKSLYPKQRLRLVNDLKLEPEARPVRRVWIPKPGTQEKRGLGMPVMHDRALQALVKLALEPEWEAKFEPNSYGFRPGRSCHDAIQAIYTCIGKKDKYVLDADIAKCFDRINHQALLDKLMTTSTVRRIIKAWLKAGVMEGETLLANIALHGLETAIREAIPDSIQVNGKKVANWKPNVIRYADDFLILHQVRSVIEHCKELTAEWLQGMGLEHKPSKTRITHTLHECDGNIGFDFLAFHVQQYPVGKTHTGRANQYSPPLGFKTIIKPSKEAVKRHLLTIKETVNEHQSQTQESLIGDLNRIITGWCQYHSRVNASETFAKVTHLTWIKLLRWAKRRHSNKSMGWIHQKYWPPGETKWNFSTKEGKRLIKHSEFSITTHIKVKGNKSPYDGDWSYWATRMGRHPELPLKKAKLLKQQKGKCASCGLYFKDGDLLEVDHIVPKAQGGKDTYANMQLLHRHCHDQKPPQGKSPEARGTHDKSQAIEEPDEINVSRPVLKTSRRGDEPA
jgi:RNA-directed DNA polymerase